MRLLIVSGCFLFFLWLSLAIWSNQPVPVPVAGMLALQLIAWGVVLGLWLRFRDRENELSKIAILSLAVLIRLPSFYATPIYEDDYFRFLWDGWNFVTNGSPYNGPPADYFDEPEMSEPLQEVLYNVNYPEVPTIYAPVCQVFFAMSSLIAPLKLWSLRLVMLVVEMFILILFGRLASSRQLLFLAWCPLLIFESSFQVHPDFLAASMLFLAFLARKNGNHILTGLCCGLALGIKVTVLPALTLMLWPLRKHSALAFTLTCLTMYLPFFAQGSRADFDGLLVFSREWEFNASLFSLGTLFFPRPVVKILMLGLFTGAFLVLWFSWRGRNSPQDKIPLTLVAIYGVFFFVSPVVNSWYLLLILPFISLAPRPWSVMALVLVCLSYIRGQTLPYGSLDDFQQPLSILLFEYLLLLALATYPLIRRNFFSRKSSSQVK